MNILVVLMVAAGAVCVLWIVQSIALALAGEPLALPLRYTTRKRPVRVVMQAAIYTTWIVILVGTPLALGIRPLDAVRHAFPTPVPWRDMAVAFSIMFFPICAANAIYIRIGWARVEPQHDRATRRAKLFRRFFGPIPLATLEELVFRGVLLEQLLQSLPHSTTWTAVAIVLSSAVFSSVHFIKRPVPGKAVWHHAYGLFLAGCLFGLAYVTGGNSLWLPITMHATAVYVIEIVRLYVIYCGPLQLMGHPEFPYGSVAGIGFAVFAGVAVVLLI